MSSDYQHPKPSEYLINAILNAVNSRNLFLLDHGCGGGRISVALAKKEVRIGLNDISQNAINNACSLFDRKKMSHMLIHKHVGLVIKWDGPNQWGSFCSHRVFHAIPQNQRILTIKFLHDGLIEKGEGIISAKSTNCNRYKLLKNDKIYREIIPHTFVRLEPFRYIYYFTKRNFTELLENAGFQIIDSKEIEEKTGNLERDDNTSMNLYWLFHIRKPGSHHCYSHKYDREKLVLFDIDGTILEQNKINEDSFNFVFEKIFNSKINLTSSDIIGKTDLQIIEGLIQKQINDKNKILPLKTLFINEYINQYINNIPNYNLELCKCVKELIYHFSGYRNIVIGLLTGNLKSIVKPKLQAVGIDTNIFKICAYGSDSSNRNLLPNIAYKRYQDKYQKTISPSSIFIVGDTPRDIECAKHSKYKSIAIATGQYSYAELLENKPDYLFNNLCNFDEIKSIILS
jgi:phosphoglycolate phosphatase-like HAD superfamily hydrolase